MRTRQGVGGLRCRTGPLLRLSFFVVTFAARATAQPSVRTATPDSPRAPARPAFPATVLPTALPASEPPAAVVRFPGTSAQALDVRANANANPPTVTNHPDGADVTVR